MPDWLEHEAEWAYWVNPETFRMPRLKGKAPLGAVLIEKNKTRTDDERVFVSTDYYLVTPSGVTTCDKSKASELLARQMVEFMKKKSAWPPHTEIKQVYQNGNVDILYAPSAYDEFTLKFTDLFVDGGVQAFLDALDPYIDEQPKWKVEPAKSSRAKCRSCGTTIEKEELRIGEPSFFQEHLSYRWHHVSCAKGILRNTVPRDLDGFNQLTHTQQIQLNGILG